MKLLKKVSIGASLALLLTTNVAASTYSVNSGETLLGITYKLGFSSLAEAKWKVPSGDINKIFPGEMLEYTAKKKKRKFVSKEKIDLKKFCFKDNRSIHYKASQRCKGNERDSAPKKQYGKKQPTHK